MLKIAETDETPKIIFDKVRQVFEVSGRSFPEDSVEFYTPVFQWLKQYADEPNSTTAFIVQTGIHQHRLFKNGTGYTHCPMERSKG